MMNRHLLLTAAFVAASAGLASGQAAAQQGSGADPAPSQDQGNYQGVSHPPADDVIVTTEIPAPRPPKPRAGQPMVAPSASVSVQIGGQIGSPAAPAPMPAPQQYQPQQYQQPQYQQPQYQQPQYQPQPQASSVDPSVNYPQPQPVEGTDDGIVRVAPSMPPSVQSQSMQSGPMLNQRAYANDPDAGIVHVQPLQPGELAEGTNIRVHLIDWLSTTDSQRGQPFRSTVASDVLQGGQVLIPAGAEIDGRIAEVSSGHPGGRGTMRLQPESIIMPDGTRYQLRAAVTSTIGSHTHVVGEGTIRPDSRMKRDSIEYGGAVGAGAITGAVVAGPWGALTGGLIGAGAVTVHLLVNHPQATLEPGTVLVFQLTDNLYLSPAAISGN